MNSQLILDEPVLPLNYGPKFASVSSFGLYV